MKAAWLALVLIPILPVWAWAEGEPAVAESMQGCRWSAFWKEIPAPRVGERARPSLPRKIRHVNPKWPKDRLRRGGSGVPTAEAVIDKNGRVIDARIVRGADWDRPWPELDEAILDAVRQWRYKPARLRGRPVSACLTVTVQISWR